MTIQVEVKHLNKGYNRDLKVTKRTPQYRIRQDGIRVQHATEYEPLGVIKGGDSYIFTLWGESVLEIEEVESK